MQGTVITYRVRVLYWSMVKQFLAEKTSKGKLNSFTTTTTIVIIIVIVIVVVMTVVAVSIFIIIIVINYHCVLFAGDTVCLTILTSFQNDRALRLSPFTALCGSKGGAMVTALASHLCGPGSTLGVLLVLIFAPGSFFSGAPVFSLPSKTNTSKFLKTPECFVGEQITNYNITLVYNTK